MSTIVFIRTSAQARLPLYARLQHQGYKLLMVHPVVDPLFQSLFHGWITHATDDIDGMIVALQQFIANSHGAFQQPAAIISYDEYGVYPAAVMAERLGLKPVPLSSEMIKLTHNKYRFREWCVEHGVRGPRSISVVHPVNMEEVTSELARNGVTFPVVIKPSVGAGSLQVSFANDVTALQNALDELFGVLMSHADAWHIKSVSDGGAVRALIEEYIGGGEVDVDCIVQDGVVKFSGISDNFAPPGRLAIEVGGMAPSGLSPRQLAAVSDLLHSYLAAVPGLTGVLHFEAKYDFDRDAAFVIEVNCRPGSAETNIMVSNAWGVHLGDALVQAALGLPLGPYIDEGFAKTSSRSGVTATLPVRTFSHEYFTSTNMFSDVECTIDHIDLPRGDAAFLEGMVNPIIPGKVKPPQMGGRMIAWMVARGASPEDAVANIRRLEASCKITVRADSQPFSIMQNHLS